VDCLARAKQRWWQILPLGPTGFGDSPYQCFSAFAGNPYLISPDTLVWDGLLTHADLDGPRFPAERVDYGPVIAFKRGMLVRAWEKFQAGAASALRPAFETFCVKQARWLDDYALFMALKDAHGGASWLHWPDEYLLRKPAALAEARRKLGNAIGQHMFAQFLFFRQWEDVKGYANGKGIRLIGDAPIFVSSDSADVWANPQLFLLDEKRQLKVVAGVPPDYFSATGQLWGNPLYDWEMLKRTGFAWWTDRLRATLAQVDVVRLDHFRGFESYWEIPAGNATAEKGRWVKAPGVELFERLRSDLGGLPLIAEDLGLITPEVGVLRDRFRLPGMRILQFAFGGGADNRYLPHNYEHNTVVYTGTHDNDTTRGWFATRPDWEAANVRRYTPLTHSIAWDMIRLAWSSVADFALAPLQDVLDLGTEARMNQPGRPAGNWNWRYTPGMINDAVLDRLGEMTSVYGR
jgi:4-alpha-glucanotransferase